MNINQKIATELSINIKQVIAAVALLDEYSVPFIARYRKEATNGLDDTQLRQLEERLMYLRELNERRDIILKGMEEKGQLTDDLKQQFLEADTKARLEDLYAPFKPKRVTKAQIARDAGLEPLAELLLSQPNLNPQEEAAKYLNPEKEINDINKALDGARYILIERFAENADLIQSLRDYMWRYGMLTSQVQKGKEEAGAKFKDYFDYQEPLTKVPSHRALAIFRGQQEEILSYQIKVQDEEVCLNMIAEIFKVNKASTWLWQVVELTWQARLKPKIESDLIMQLR
ncbi:MAG: Tex-like N-terminal domain-containing protein, partial [Pseudomonadota bacterium]